MIVTIHQPNLFPWLGFFAKMAASDLFILLDHVPFTKGGYQNRVRLKGAGGEHWLSIPVLTKGKLGQPTNEVEVIPNLSWKKEHLHMFAANYGKTPYFREVYARLETFYEGEHPGLLVNFTIAGIELMRELLQIRTPLLRSSELNFKGSGSQLLCGLVKRVGGTVYLSGPSGQSYLDESAFAADGIRVLYHRYETFAYSQPFGSFAGGLSTLDYMFNTGGAAGWKRGDIA